MQSLSNSAFLLKPQMNANERKFMIRQEVDLIGSDPSF